MIFSSNGIDQLTQSDLTLKTPEIPFLNLHHSNLFYGCGIPMDQRRVISTSQTHFKMALWLQNPQNLHFWAGADDLAMVYSNL